MVRLDPSSTLEHLCNARERAPGLGNAPLCVRWYRDNNQGLGGKAVNPLRSSLQQQPLNSSHKKD